MFVYKMLDDNHFEVTGDNYQSVFIGDENTAKNIVNQLNLQLNSNKLVITSLTSSDQNAIIDLDNHEITVHENQSVTADFEIHKISDNSLNTDYSGTFRMPLKKQSTGDIIYTLVTINGGKGSLNFTMPSHTVGLWQITQELINEKLPPELQLQFEGLDIYVVIGD